MSLLLCHECYGWVEPSAGHCPDCMHPIDASVPDRPLHELQSIIGEIICRVGEVRVQRSLLPDRGMLYATSKGLFFLPHQIERMTHVVETNGKTTSILWSLAAMIWSPLAIVLPFLKSSRLQAKHVDVYRPQFLTAEDSHHLAELLMRNPGVFFVPKKSIRILQRRRNNWLVERVQGPLLKLRPNSNPRRFHSRMAELADSHTWQDVMFEFKKM